MPVEDVEGVDDHGLVVSVMLFGGRFVVELGNLIAQVTRSLSAVAEMRSLAFGDGRLRDASLFGKDGRGCFGLGRWGSAGGWDGMISGRRQYIIRGLFVSYHHPSWRHMRHSDKSAELSLDRWVVEYLPCVVSGRPERPVH